jgi:5-methylcytosine-specific restriction endonuclease McrA
MHIDHIYPVSRGGGDELSNLQVTHSRCNMAKGSRV